MNKKMDYNENMIWKMLTKNSNCNEVYQYQNNNTNGSKRERYRDCRLKRCKKYLETLYTNRSTSQKRLNCNKKKEEAAQAIKTHKNGKVSDVVDICDETVRIILAGKQRLSC